MYPVWEDHKRDLKIWNLCLEITNKSLCDKTVMQSFRLALARHSPPLHSAKHTSETGATVCLWPYRSAEVL